MDQVSASDTTTELGRARRRRMRAQARGQRAAPPKQDEYQTPEWLDHSFVLPLTEPEGNELPGQAAPRHDDFGTALVQTRAAEPEGHSAPLFVRPTTPEVDFARVIRRSDLGRSATRTVMASTGMTGLLLIAYLLTFSPVVLGMVISLGVVALVAVAIRVRVATAAIPHLDR